MGAHGDALPQALHASTPAAAKMVAEGTTIPYWPIIHPTQYDVRGINHSSNASFVSVQSSIGAKGDWYALSNSALVYPAFGFHLMFHSQTAAFRSLVDVGISAIGGTIAIPAAAVTPIVSNLHYSNAGRLPASLLFPIPLDPGQRLWLRAQSTSAQVLSGAINLFNAPWSGLPQHGIVSAYGHSLGNAAGTAVDAGATAGIPGAWSQLTSRTEYDIYWLVITVGLRSNTAMTTGFYALDIGVGPVGAERIVIRGLPLTAESSADFVAPAGFGALPVFIPRGSRVVARITSSITDATDRVLEVVVHGIS